MDSLELLRDGFEKVLSGVEHVLEGLEAEDLAWQPRPDCNSIGWLAWHLVREQDSAISYLMKAGQIWIAEGWHEKYGRAADPRDIGTGHTVEEAGAFRSPDIPVALDYHRAVLERTKKYLDSLTIQELDRVVNLKYLPPLTTVGTFLITIMADGLEHAGQMGYVRGLHHGIGWQKY